MKKDNMTELAKLFRNRDPVVLPSVTTGTVVAAPPNPKIRLDDVIVLDKDNLVFSADLLSGYERGIKFTDGSISVNTTTTFTDGLKKNDEVILIPAANEQVFYVAGKAVRF